MCGICGIVAEDESLVTEEALGRMCAVLQHRGPDDQGVYVRGRAGLGHRRLSIIDVEGGHQPMCNEDESVWIVFNGEIYNFQELRPDLEAKGHRFQTRSDTEVILHLYEEEGTDCLQQLRGMFAFAIWDESKQQLFLARDRLGQKPLYYYQSADRFLFASEPKAILEDRSVPREVDLQALDQYLAYQCVPYPLTMFKGLAKLPPAHYLTLRDGRMDVRRYWELHFEPDASLTEEACAGRLRELLEEATRLRLISDVPLGAFLSGGIDSSITVGLMSKLSNERVRTFSIGFEEKKYDELEYARLIAERYQTDHHEFVVRPNAIEIMPALIWHYGEPFADSSAIPTYYVSQVTGEHVKVVLTGDAGDECFAGYPRYKACKLARYVDRLPRPLRALITAKLWQKLPASVEQKTLRRRFKRLSAGLARPERQRYYEWIAIFGDEARDSLYTDDLLASLADSAPFELLDSEYERCGDEDFVSATTFVDLMTYLPNDLLVKVDIASMAHSLEARSPFLDHKLIEFAATVPIDLKLRGFRDKFILKRAFADLLPEQIVARKKMGFGVPISRWFREELRDYLREALLDSQSLDRGYFRPGTVRDLVETHIAGRQDHGYQLWALLNFELWHRMFIDGSLTYERKSA